MAQIQLDIGDYLKESQRIWLTLTINPR
jgi:hypothetical protein